MDQPPRQLSAAHYRRRHHVVNFRLKNSSTEQVAGVEASGQPSPLMHYVDPTLLRLESVYNPKAGLNETGEIRCGAPRTL